MDWNKDKQNYEEFSIKKNGKDKVPHCRNISKIKLKYKRNGNKIDTHNTHIHDLSLSWFGDATSIKGSGVKLVLWAHAY
jgi:hypothetical protein